MPDQMRRAAFLAGQGTLTLAEVREWANELAPGQFVILPPVPESEPLMVSVVPGPPDTRGLSNAVVL